MKKILYIMACVAMLFAASCNKESMSHEGEGAVSFTLNSGVRSGATDPFAAVYDKLTFRIYQVANKGTATESETLVRLYSYKEIMNMNADGHTSKPIWLLAGDYRVTVSGGDESKYGASFTEIYYKGSADFTVAEDMANKTVEVTCRPSNTMIKVVFDASVGQNMEDAQVVVAIDEVYDPIAVAAKSVPALTYKQSSGNSIIGYFTPEAGADKFAWHFSGKVPSKDNREVVKEAVQEIIGGLKEGYMYTITFKYSPDLGGYMTFNITVDTNPTTIHNDIATFKPEPQFSDVDGGGVVNKTAYLNSASTVSYNVKAINPIIEASMKVGGQTLTYTASQVNAAATVRSSKFFTDAANGVEIEVVNDKEWVISLQPTFMSKLSVGREEYFVTVTDDSGTSAEYVQDYIGEGVNAGELKTWFGYAALSAYVTASNAQNVKVVYKKDDGEWQEIAAKQSTSVDKLWEVQLPVNGQANFEYYWRYDGKDNMSAANSTFSTPAAPQIPNGGLEEWDGDCPLLAYTSKQWWDTGNHGSATLGKNVTTNSTDVRPGSTGQYSAFLKSQFVGLGVGKFAAGNIFFGKYLETVGTNGIIGFGQEYKFVYKPKKLIVWYKGKVGTCDYAGGAVKKGGSDKNQIYVWLCNWTGRHAVNTADTTTFVNPTETTSTPEGNVIAYGEWHRVITENVDDGSDNGWQKLEIPITYREGEGFDDAVPNYLVISCAASGYGDYFAGSTESYMYIDDIEFEY